MKKNLIILCLMITSSLAYSQVGINTPNPQGALHIDGAKDNPTTGAPNADEQANDFTVTNTGSVGVGTTTPTSKVEINSGTANTSGLKLTNLTSATPVSAGATLGVDATGSVVTVQGSSFMPAFGRTTLGSTVNILPNTTNFNLLSFTLPSAGTYLITYSTRGEIQVTGGAGWLVSFLSTAPTAGNVISNTEILVITSRDESRQVIGGTGTGSLIVTVTEPTTYYLGIKSQNLAGIVFNNADGRTSVTYAKITP